MEKTTGQDDSNGVNRRELLGTIAAGGGLSDVASRSTANSLPGDGVVGEVIDCFLDVEVTPEDYPRLDCTSSEPELCGAAPDAPDELVLHAHGWLGEGFLGLSQAKTFEKALRANGYEQPVVSVQWEAIDFDFRSAGDKADVGGERLADWLRMYTDEHPETTIRLAGLSLGCRLPLATLDALDGDATVATTTLFGASVPNAHVCLDTDAGYDGEAIDASAERVYNYHSLEDDFICTLYEFETEGLGCRGADCGDDATNGDKPDAYVDIDVTETVTEHCAYQATEGGIVPQVVEQFRAVDSS